MDLNGIEQLIDRNETTGDEEMTKTKIILPLVSNSLHVGYAEPGRIESILITKSAIRDLIEDVLLVKVESAVLKPSESAVVHDGDGCYLLITNWPKK